MPQNPGRKREPAAAIRRATGIFMLWAAVSILASGLPEAAGEEPPPRVDGTPDLRTNNPLPSDADPFPERPLLPALQIRGFSDFSFQGHLTENDQQNTFALGAVDLFVTSRLSERIGFLAETVFEFDEETNQAEFELERASLSYFLSDAMKIDAGRIHTPLGYWNQAFHHGTWLQTTIFRPAVYRFEDDGGLLPTHLTGLDAHGLLTLPALDLTYHIGVFNGRGRSPGEIQQIRDNNPSKAFLLLIGLTPLRVQTLALGSLVYWDKIPADPDNPSRNGSIRERILGGHLTYTDSRVELLAEFFHLYHDDEVSGKDFNTVGGYLQASHGFGAWRPYYRFDWLAFERGDPYFSGREDDLRGQTLGLRWDYSDWSAVKFEYQYQDRSADPNRHTATINVSFTF